MKRKGEEKGEEESKLEERRREEKVGRGEERRENLCCCLSSDRRLEGRVSLSLAQRVPRGADLNQIFPPLVGLQQRGLCPASQHRHIPA